MADADDYNEIIHAFYNVILYQTHARINSFSKYPEVIIRKKVNAVKKDSSLKVTNETNNKTENER